MLLLLAALAHATPVQLRVAGVSKAQAVLGVVRDAEGARVAPCNDAGTGSDQAVDGVFTCEDIELEGDTGAVLAIVDGKLTDAGVLTWEAGKPRVAALEVSGGMVQISTDGSSLTLSAGGRPRPAVPIVLARLPQYGTGPAPVLVLGGGATQLNCHDDGSFPDRQVNDGEPGCAGFLAADKADVMMNSGDGKSIPLGVVTWPAGPIRYLTVDVKAAASSSAPFEMPLPPMPSLTGGTTAAAAQAPSPESASTATVTPPAAEASPVKAEPKADAKPVAQEAASSHLPGVGETPFGPWLWAALGLGGVGGIAFVRARRTRTFTVRPTLRAHPAPPLFPGGPMWSEAAVLRVDDPVALLPELLRMLTEQRRVVVVLPGRTQLPPVGGAGVWVATVPTWEEIAAGVMALARTEGAPVAVVILGGDTVTDPGALNPESLGHLVRALPPGVWMGVIATPDETVSTWMPVWRVSGPPWVGVRN